MLTWQPRGSNYLHHHRDGRACVPRDGMRRVVGEGISFCCVLSDRLRASMAADAGHASQELLLRNVKVAAKIDKAIATPGK
jgi:hypothetical protein